MKVILLSGPSNSGKTTTLTLVYDELIRLGATVIRPKSPLGGDPADFECVVSYAGKVVAIFTMGDFAIEVVHAMSYYEGMGCDALIVANSNKSWPVWRLGRYPGSVSLSKTLPLSNASNDNDKRFIISHV